MNTQRRGTLKFELLLLLVALCVLGSVMVPAWWYARHQAQMETCRARLGLLQKLKDNIRIKYQLKPNDPLTEFHIAEMNALTYKTAWSFHPEDPCPLGGEITLGNNFQEQPQCSLCQFEELWDVATFRHTPTPTATAKPGETSWWWDWLQ